MNNPETHTPTIQVGIMSAASVGFRLHGVFRFHEENDRETTSAYQLEYRNGRIVDTVSGKLYNQLHFTPVTKACSIEIEKVTIGIDFHWERTETQEFAGSLRVIPDGQQLCVINVIEVEQYLQSVISSEMSANASPEFLKTHAVISRSWLLAQMEKRQTAPAQQHQSLTRSNSEWIQWFDREDHHLFDVCADDHCQRYQGVSRIVSPAAKEAVDATRGMILTHKGAICDARFYKCCGGVTETFESAWEPVHYPYLTRVSDAPSSIPADLTDETQAREWILASPPAYCNTTDKHILQQVLNNYDLETTDFYRWKASYSQSELSALIASRSGIDFGTVTDLVPLKRGVSGRITRLRIVGTLRTMTIGKELLIRKWLSTSHLYSSAFVVAKSSETDGSTTFTLHGAGWGHGVGLCQIGAAMMCSQGFSFRQILNHYYPQSTVEKRYG
jgi:SpoIID/LytB domain protein